MGGALWQDSLARLGKDKVMAKWEVKWTDETWYRTYVDVDSRQDAYDMLLSGEFDDAKSYHVERMDTDISIELVKG